MRPSYGGLEAPTHLPPGLFDVTDSTPTERRQQSPLLARAPDRDQPDVEPASLSAIRTEPASSSRASKYNEPLSATPSGHRVARTPTAGAPRGEPAIAPRTAPRAAPHQAARTAARAAKAAPARAASASAPAVQPARQDPPPPPQEQAAWQAGPQPPPPPLPQAPPPGPQASLGGLGPIDPLAIPTPPELAGPIYGYIRRLALQSDLAGGDRVLRDALAELTSSLSCAIVYPGQDGLWTLGNDDEIPRDAQPLVTVANARRAVIASHLALIPIVTTTETVAVVALTRNPRQPAYQLLEQVAMVALAREAAPILHHLAVQHLQRATEIKADKGSLYRGEALEAHRTRGQEGTLVHLSPAWVKRAYPLLIITLIAAVVFTVFIRVPTYSSGTAVIVFEGSTSVTATASGTVEKVVVHANEAVKKGDPLIRLSSPDELAALAAAEAEWHDTEIQFLFDQSDPQIAKALATAATNRAHTLARVEARTIRAPRDGVITNVHVKEGAAVQLGGYVLQITDENSEIEVLAFLPGKDGPRIRSHMPLQLDLDGYKKARAIGAITHVQPDAISGAEAAKLGGDMLVDSIGKDLAALPSTTWIAVRARLPSRTFTTEHSTYHYHHGMHAQVDVKLQSKPFLITLLPALEKYLPD